MARKMLVKPIEFGKAIGAKNALLEKEQDALEAKAKEEGKPFVRSKVPLSDPKVNIKSGVNGWTGLSLVVARDGFRQGFLSEREKKED